MGGIPYQSQGCAACKKRKKKCDLQKPECERCLKRGTPCPGYNKDRNFVHHTVVTRVEQRGMTKRPIPQLVNQMNPIALPPMLNMSAEVRTQLFQAFLGTVFPPNAHKYAKADSWYILLAGFPSMAGESELLDRAIFAFASVFLGKKKQNLQLTHHGVQLYTNAINVMSRRVHRNCLPTSDLLYSAIVFATYESFLDTTGLGNAFAHVQGTNALLKKFKFDPSNRVISAIYNQQKWATSFFVSDARRPQADFKWLSESKGTTPIDDVFRLIAQAAFCLEELDRIRAAEPQDYQDRQDVCDALINRCYDLEAKFLTDWFTNQAPLVGGKPTAVDREKFACEFQTLHWDPNFAPYDFDSLDAAKIYILLWSAMIVINRVAYETQTMLIPDPDPTSLLFYVNEVCRSIAYCLTPELRHWTGRVLLFAMSQTSRAYIVCGLDQGFFWCQHIYTILLRVGFSMAPSMSETERQYWEASQAGRAWTPLSVDEYETGESWTLPRR